MNNSAVNNDSTAENAKSAAAEEKKAAKAAAKDEKKAAKIAKKTLKKEKKASKRRTHKLLKILIALMVLIAVVVFVFFGWQLDWYGVQTKTFAFVNSINPDYKDVFAYEEILKTREAELSEREAEIKAEASRLKELSAQLDARAATVTEREESIKAQKGTPIYRRPADTMSDQETTDMQNLAAMYEKMEPSSVAANILSLLSSTEDMAAVIYFMTPETAAKVLAQMEPIVAADITNRLLRY